MLRETELSTSCSCILRLCQHLCKTFPGERGERNCKVLTSSWDVSEMPQELPGSDGEQGSHGTAPRMSPSGHTGLNLPLPINHSGTRNR